MATRHCFEGSFLSELAIVTLINLHQCLLAACLLYAMFGAKPKVTHSIVSVWVPHGHLCFIHT